MNQVAEMPRKPKRNDLAVKIDAEVVRDAKVVAAAKGIPLAELLSDLLRPLVGKELERYISTKRPKKPSDN